MNKQEVDYIVAELVPAVSDYVGQAVEKATAPLLLRLSILESRGFEKGDKGDPGEPGKSITVQDLMPAIHDAVAALPPAEPGKSVDPQEVAELVAAEVSKAVSAIPVPANGKDADLAEVRLFIAEEVAKIPPPTNGKDADPAAVAALVATEVEKAVALLPPAEPGRSVTVEDVRQLVVEEVAKIPVAKDGIGLAGAMIDRDGALVITLTDGSQRSLGPVVGKDGKDGRNGTPGLGPDDLKFEYDGERKFTARFQRGEQIEESEFELPIPIDRGVWKPGPFVKGDVVSLGGQMFIARRVTTAEPMTPDAKDDWRLCVKKGRDGKDFRPETKSQPEPVRFK